MFWLIVSLIPTGILVYNYINQAGYESYIKERLEELKDKIMNRDKDVSIARALK